MASSLSGINGDGVGGVGAGGRAGWVQELEGGV